MRRVKKACVSSSAIPSWWSTQPSRVTLMLKVNSPMVSSVGDTRRGAPKSGKRKIERRSLAFDTVFSATDEAQATSAEAHVNLASTGSETRPTSRRNNKSKKAPISQGLFVSCAGAILRVDNSVFDLTGSPLERLKKGPWIHLRL